MTMKITALTLLISEINHLIDTGKYDDISISDIHKAIEGKRVLRFLKDRVGADIDISLYLKTNTYGNFEAYYEQKLNYIYGGYAGQERRKWKIEHRGLCLLLAWTNEIVQQGEGLEWSRHRLTHRSTGRAKTACR